MAFKERENEVFHRGSMSLCFSAEYHVLVSLEGCAFATVLPFCGAEVVVTDEPNDDVFACL